MGTEPAEQRNLLLELPGVGGGVIEALRAFATQLPLLSQMQAVVVADTAALRTDQIVIFQVWQPAIADESEISEIVVRTPAGVPAKTGLLALLTSHPEEFARAAKASNSLRGYRSDWEEFF